jgi:hypothetical protein
MASMSSRSSCSTVNDLRGRSGLGLQHVGRRILLCTALTERVQARLVEVEPVWWIVLVA